jgi:hypothetical protein
MEMNAQLQAPAALPLWKKRRYAMDTRLGDRQSRSGRSSEQKKYLPFPYQETNAGRPDRWINNSVVQYY